MAYHRMSRGTPFMLTVSEQREWLEDLESNPDLQKAVEDCSGIQISQMRPQERLSAMSRLLRTGSRQQPFNAAIRAIEETKRLAAQHRGEEDVAGQLQLARQELDELRAENARLQGKEGS